MDEYEDLDAYNGDTVHDIEVDHNFNINTEHCLTSSETPLSKILLTISMTGIND